MFINIVHSVIIPYPLHTPPPPDKKEIPKTYHKC